MSPEDNRWVKDVGIKADWASEKYFWISFKVQYLKNCKTHTVLIFLGRGIGVSAVPAGVPLVSSAAGWEGVPIFACWLGDGESRGCGCGCGWTCGWGGGGGCVCGRCTVSAGGGLGADSAVPGFGGMSARWGFGGRSLSWGLGGRSPSWGLGGRSESCGFGGSSPGLGGSSDGCGLGGRSPSWGLSARGVFCGVSVAGGDFWKTSGGWLGLSIDGWCMVSIFRNATGENDAHLISSFSCLRLRFSENWSNTHLFEVVWEEPLDQVLTLCCLKYCCEKTVTRGQKDAQSSFWQVDWARRVLVPLLLRNSFKLVGNRRHLADRRRGGVTS